MVIDIEEKKNLMEAVKVMEEMNREQLGHLEKILEMDNPVDRVKYTRALPEKDAAKIIGFFCVLTEGAY